MPVKVKMLQNHEGARKGDEVVFEDVAEARKVVGLGKATPLSPLAMTETVKDKPWLKKPGA